MSISIHIPFYNPNPEKKEGFRNLRRFDYLKENILNLKSLSIKNDIFIHTHNDFLDDKNLEVKIIKHKIDEDNLNKGYLTWLCRSLMEKQKNDYEYFMYLEHDIKFSENNLKYLQKYQETLAQKSFHLGFLIYEKNNSDNQNYSIHIVKKLDSYLEINSQKSLSFLALGKINFERSLYKLAKTYYDSTIFYYEKQPLIAISTYSWIVNKRS